MTRGVSRPAEGASERMAGAPNLARASLWCDARCTTLATLPAERCLAGTETCEDPTAVYEGTWESVGTHTVPDWYDDAKLGVFLHWGLYSVPGWAPRVPDIQQLLVKRRPQADAAREPLRRVVPELAADQGQSHPAAPRPHLRRRLPLRQLRQDVQRRVGGGEPRGHGRRLPVRRRALRRPDDQAPRRLRAVALGHRPPDQGPLSRDA